MKYRLHNAVSSPDLDLHSISIQLQIGQGEAVKIRAAKV
jgi:hypothetical protein